MRARQIWRVSAPLLLAGSEIVQGARGGKRWGRGRVAAQRRTVCSPEVRNALARYCPSLAHGCYAMMPQNSARTKQTDKGKVCLFSPPQIQEAMRRECAGASHANLIYRR